MRLKLELLWTVLVFFISMAIMVIVTPLWMFEGEQGRILGLFKDYVEGLEELEEVSV